MSRKEITTSLKRSKLFFKSSFGVVVTLLIISLFVACSVPTATTRPPASSAPPSPTTAPTSSAASVKPLGELIAGLASFGNENFLPWKSDMQASQICCIVYDLLIYYDEVNRKFIPGLAESWDLSPDAMTLTYHLRKGVQFSDGWGEFSSADVKYTFEQHAQKDSIGLTSAARSIASMDTPDPYTLTVDFKTAQPTFFATFSMGNNGSCQGIVCKKYVEPAGNAAASQKPIGTGPYKVVSSQLGSFYKFEAKDNHWRVVPEFKTLTLRMVPEISTTVAMLKTKELDLANVTAEQLPDLKSSGLATEVSQVGGSIIVVSWGGMVIPEDNRYDASIHNKDPWVDPRVRKAMTISIDRQAICKAIFAGGAFPAGAVLFTGDMDKYQYSFDPTAARQLLTEAGYPKGFSFNLMSYTQPGVPETPRIMEALAGYWQQIGLDPQINEIDYSTYGNTHRMTLKMAGEVSPQRISPVVDMLTRAALHFVPGGPVILFEDEGSYAIWKEGNTKFKAEERDVYVDKLQQYFYENYGPIPIVRSGYCFAWNSDKISAFPHAGGSLPMYLEYVCHAQPTNTFRLFSPWQGR